jgi:hypothetical protein
VVEISRRGVNEVLALLDDPWRLPKKKRRSHLWDVTLSKIREERKSGIHLPASQFIEQNPLIRVQIYI